MRPLFPILAIIAIFIPIRLLIGRLNHSRIRQYIASQGGRVIKITWDPFGAGWFGEKDSVIYQVRYADQDGNVRNAHCKTGIFSGVYFSNDMIVKAAAYRMRTAPSANPQPVAAPRREPGPAVDDDKNSLQFEIKRLKEENRMLREELERVRRQG